MPMISEERVHQWRDDVPDGLRQNDEAVLPPIRQTERVGREMPGRLMCFEAAHFSIHLF